MAGDAILEGGRDATLALHRAGKLDRARAGYERLLIAQPGDADLLGLLGVLAIQQQRSAEAEELLAQALKTPPPDSRIHLRNVNNMFALLKEQGRADAASELASAPLPGWPDNTSPSASERPTILSLVEALSSLGQEERALALLEESLAYFGEDPDALILAGSLRLRCGEPDAALSILERAIEYDPTNWFGLANLSTANNALDNLAEAREAARRCARAAALYVAPERPGHEATILVLNRSPKLITNAPRDLHRLHFSKNYISQASSTLANEYRFASVFADLPDPLPDLPAVDVVFNNIASGEVLGIPGSLDQIIERVERIGKPIINHPHGVSQMTRQTAAALLQGIPGLRVPQIARYWRDLERFGEIEADVAERFGYPVILRHVAADESSQSLLSDDKTAILVQDADELRQFLQGVSWAQFYAIQYVNLRKADGNFRKLRAAFSPDEIIIVACGYYSEWMVSGWRKNEQGQAFYNAFPDRVIDMQRTLREPEAVLGPQFMPVLEAVRERVPLDVFGMDFDLNDDGEVVFFEAQSSMILLMPSSGIPEHLQLPVVLSDRVNEAFRRLVRRKIAGSE